VGVVDGCKVFACTVVCPLTSLGTASELVRRCQEEIGLALLETV
jgi:hypothetical protein